MRLVTLGVFLALVGGLGAGLLALLPRRSRLETLLLCPVVGLGALAPVLLAFRLLHLPLDHRLLLAVAALGALAALLRRGPREPSPGRRHLASGAGAAAASIALAAVMYAGAQAYPWLEDDDPWQHAAGARYVALHRTSAQADPPASHYLEPYPPYFTATMGVLHQTSGDLRWILKFFNALIVGLSVLAAFHALAALSGDPVKGLVGAAILAASPSWMSHFIWAQTLALPVFLAATWALVRVEEGGAPLRSGRFWLAAVLSWSATIVQPSASAVAALLLATIGIAAGVARFRAARRVSARLLAVLAGGLLSFLTWAGTIARYGWERVREAIAIAPGMFSGASNVDTSGGEVYGLADVVLATAEGKIDQSIGLGWATAALALAGLAVVLARWRAGRLREGRPELLVLLWLAIALAGVEGNALPVKVFPHRFWPFLALPVAFLAAEAVAAAAALAPGPRLRALAVAGLAAVAVGTNLPARVGMQTRQWPPGISWRGPEHLQAYLELSERVPRWTRVLPLCSPESLLIGLNLAAEPWDPELARLKAGLGAGDGARVVSFMRARGYDYLVVDGGCPERLGTDAALALWHGLGATGALRLHLDFGSVLVLRRIGDDRSAL